MTATLTSPTFVGRTEELARLAAAGDRAAGGTPTAVLVGGRGRGRQDPPGRRGGGRGPRQPGRPSLVGGCVELGGEGVPFAPLIEALRRVRPRPRRARPGQAAPRPCPVRAGPPPPRARPRSPAQGVADPGSARAGAVHNPRAVVGAGAAVRAAAGAAGAPGRGAAGRCWWWRTCTGPTARPATCWPSWSATCARRRARAHLPQRRAAPPPPAAAVPGRAGPQRPGRAAGAGPVRPAEVAAELLPGSSGTPVPPRWSRDPRPLRRATPFFVEELLAAHRRAELPLSLRDLLLARVEAPVRSRPSGCWRWPRLAGTRVDHELLAAVVGRTARAELLCRCCARRSPPRAAVDEASGAYGFRHALVQEAVYDDLLPVQRDRCMPPTPGPGAPHRAARRGRDVASATAVERRPARLPLVRRPRPGAGPAGGVAGRAGRGAAVRLRRGPAPVTSGPWSCGTRCRRRPPEPRGIDRPAAGPGRRGGRQPAGDAERAVALVRLALAGSTRSPSRCGPARSLSGWPLPPADRRPARGDGRLRGAVASDPAEPPSAELARALAGPRPGC